MSQIKDLTQGVLKQFGYELRKKDAPLHTMARGLELLAERIGDSGFAVMDIGVAQGTPELYAAFPPEKNAYLLVEANPNYHKPVSDLAKRFGGRAEFVFCGAEPGTAPFNIYASGRKSSAFLSIADEPIRVVDLEVRPLDELARSHGLAASPVVLKIDVEGAELEVLKGAAETLKRCTAVIAEAGLVERYEGGALFADIVSFMRDKGFAPFDIIGGGVVGTRLNLVDVIFLPESALS